MRRSRTSSLTDSLALGAPPSTGITTGLLSVRARGVDAFDIGVGEARNLLGLAVVGYGELIFAQALDRIAGFVGDFHVDAHQFGFRTERRARRVTR